MLIRLILSLYLITCVFAVPRHEIGFKDSKTEDEDYYLNTVQNDKDFLRIMNASTFDIKKNSYTLALLNKNNDLIGGAVLIYNDNDKWALTSAWNVIDVKASDLVIRSYTGNCFVRGHRSYVSQIIIHEGYNGWKSNVALLKIGTSGFKNEQAIPIAANLPKQGSNLTIIGWGSTNGHKWSDGNVRKAEAQFLSYDTCSAYYGAEDNFSNTSFCTRNSQNFGPCYKDYGSPVVYEGTLVGIFSGSLSCSNPKYPAVHVDLTQYKDWIKSKTRI